MSADLVPLVDRLRYAEALAQASLLPQAYRKQPANVLLAMEYGAALGLSPLHAIQGVHIIDGKPTASAQLIAALVRRAGHRLRVEGDDTRAVVEVRRSDDPDYAFRSEWTLDRAKQAGLLGKGTWKQYPAAMLKARAITEAARDACPEALAGIAYTAEELGADDVTATFPADQPPPAAPRVQPRQLAAPPAPAIEGVEPSTEADPTEAAPPEIDALDPERAAVEDTADPVTEAQLVALAARMGAAGLKTKDERLNYARAFIGRDLTTSRDLTTTEAGRLLEDLATGGQPNGPDPDA